MSSPSILFSFATTMVLYLLINDVRSKYHIEFGSNYPNGHTYTEVDVLHTSPCTSFDKRTARNSTYEKCKPQLQSVKLNLTRFETNIETFPSVVTVKRCVGYCKGPLSCVPTKVSIAQIPALQIDHNRRHAPTCINLHVEQHDECKCGCSTLSQHCSNKQYYNRATCSCNCIEQEKKNWCLYSPTDPNKRRHWDEESCSCQCITTDCPRPSLFGQEILSCEPPEIPQDVNSYESANSMNEIRM